jgi:hypothetical protein
VLETKASNDTAVVELLVPVSVDPAAVESFARDALDVVSVRSGHGGVFAHVWTRYSKDDPRPAVRDWLRRFVGLETTQTDVFAANSRRRLRGSSWLTVVGRPFIGALDAAQAFSSLPSDVRRIDGVHGTLFVAGAAPSLGDTKHADLPRGVMAVARAIAPLAIGSCERDLDILGKHYATQAYLQRFTNPRDWLVPTRTEV